MSASDRARDFWDRISPRERRLVVLLGIAAPITIAIFLGLQIKDGLDNIEARNAKTRRALLVLTDLRAGGPLQPTDDVVATMGVEPISLDTYLRNAGDDDDDNDGIGDGADPVDDNPNVWRQRQRPV